ncbi:MAG: hypothetical protein JSU86_05885 [Phycisphaerales bacterium]|nr:MAG: hypothetical protein JSU86_05885 [Phycisphaerales bacterium]
MAAAGGGTFDVHVELYVGSPCQPSSVPIAGTAASFFSIPDDGSLHWINAQFTPVSIPNSFYMKVEFSTDLAGWAIAHQAELGFSADAFAGYLDTDYNGLPDTCLRSWSWYGDPYASFWADVYCAPIGACCRGPFCSIQTQAECTAASGRYEGDGTDCGTPDPCVTQQACCLEDRSCTVTDHIDCVARGGDPQGPQTETCQEVVCQPLKWSQPPTFNPDSQHPECFWGWDEPSVYNEWQIVADDWACMDEAPVTDIHWWGSYLGWDGTSAPQAAPDSFHIGVWTNVPANPQDPDSFSHPGRMIRQWTVARDDLNERPVACDWHPEHMDPAFGEGCFRYDYIIPEAEWFYQEPACTIYWISISAVYSGIPPDEVWGWKTRRPEWTDDAVKIVSPTNPIPGDEFSDGEPVENVEGSWDMAFVLTTGCQPSDPPVEPAGEAGYEKIRYISMVPGNPGRQTALRVTLANLPAPFDGFNGTRCWIGAPQSVSENAGKISHEPGWPDFLSANLQGTPHCMDWSTVGVLHVTDDDIIPGAVYDVQAINCNCDFGNEVHYSAPLTITTSRWADLVGTCAIIPCTSPDGSVGIPTDVTACLDKFKNLAGAVLKSRADIEPNLPDWSVNISDVTYVLDAFRGFIYPPAQTPPAPGWTGPDGCP